MPGAVLVLEDEAPVLRLIGLVLKQTGREVISAETGEQALDAARRHAGPIDLLVADVILRDQNGPEFARRLLAMHPGMACLFISGYPEQELQNRDLLEHGRLNAPHVAFLPKPFKPAELLLAVQRLINGEA